jgi:hypothetical protein
MSKPTLRIHTHWQVAQSHPAIQNLPKSMAAPTHGRQKSAANLEENKTDGNERQYTTSYIKHMAVSGFSSGAARIKSGCNLIGNRFEMPNVSYT